MKPLKLKDEDRVSPGERAEVLGISLEQAQRDGITITHRKRVRAAADAHGISHDIADQVAEQTMPASDKLYQNMAEMAYSPPAQTDAFKPALPINQAGKKLQAYFERIERLEEEKHALQEDIAEIFNEAKGEGWDVAAMRALLKIRSDDDAETRLAMIKLYHDETGMTVWPA